MFMGRVSKRYFLPIDLVLLFSIPLKCRSHMNWRLPAALFRRWLRKTARICVNYNIRIWAHEEKMRHQIYQLSFSGLRLLGVSTFFSKRLALVTREEITLGRSAICPTYIKICALIRITLYAAAVIGELLGSWWVQNQELAVNLLWKKKPWSWCKGTRLTHTSELCTRA